MLQKCLLVLQGWTTLLETWRDARYIEVTPKVVHLSQCASLKSEVPMKLKCAPWMDPPMKELRVFVLKPSKPRGLSSMSIACSSYWYDRSYVLPYKASSSSLNIDSGHISAGRSLLSFRDIFVQVWEQEFINYDTWFLIPPLRSQLVTWFIISAILFQSLLAQPIIGEKIHKEVICKGFILQRS